MNEIEKELKDICHNYDLPQRHTDFQIEHFIIGKESSFYGRIWQCLRELQQRYETIQAVDCELLDIEDNIKLEEIELKKLQIKNKNYESPISQELAELKKQKKEIILRKQTRKVDSYKKSLDKTRQRKMEVLAECRKFIEVFKTLINEKSFVDINDPQAQLEFWNAKFGSELNLHAMLNHPMNAELVKSVLALPNESNIKGQLINAFDNLGKKLKLQSN
jgi:hypothetical protein